jgi:hypothetical protein
MYVCMYVDLVEASQAMRKYRSICACMHVCVRMYTCMHMNVSLHHRTLRHTPIHTRTHRYTHTCIPESLFACPLSRHRVDTQQRETEEGGTLIQALMGGDSESLASALLRRYAFGFLFVCMHMYVCGMHAFRHSWEATAKVWHLRC